MDQIDEGAEWHSGSGARLSMLQGVVESSVGHRYHVVIEFHPSRPTPDTPVALIILLDPLVESAAEGSGSV